MVLACSPGLPPGDGWLALPLACLGIWLVASCGGCLQLHRRTGHRRQDEAHRLAPTAKGTLSNSQTLLFSAVLCVAGSALLYVWVNPLTMWLTFATFVGYAVIYTVVLKPLTPQNIVIGGASGRHAAGAGLGGDDRRRGPEALILFLIIFLWTPPHFWALALYRVEDYRKSPACPCCRSPTAASSRGCRCCCTPWCCSRLPAALCLRHERLDLSGWRPWC
jgi:protoheme IX farnesyltransferase